MFWYYVNMGFAATPPSARTARYSTSWNFWNRHDFCRSWRNKRTHSSLTDCPLQYGRRANELQGAGNLPSYKMKFYRCIFLRIRDNTTISCYFNYLGT